MKKYIAALLSAIFLSGLCMAEDKKEKKKDLPNIKVCWVYDFMTYEIPDEPELRGFFVKGLASGKIQPAALQTGLTNEEIFKFCKAKEKEGHTFFHVFMLRDDKKKRKAVLSSKEKFEIVYGKAAEAHMVTSVLKMESEKNKK
jgi:hypothetical protein